MKKFLLALLFLPMLALAGTATLTWTAPTLNTDGTAIVGAISYKVYGAIQGQPKLLLASPTLLTFTHNPAGGATWCYDVTANVAAQESAHSGEACKVIPLPVPNPPSNVTIAAVTGATFTPAYKYVVSTLGVATRSTVLAGLVPLGAPCGPALLFSYRSKPYRQVPQSAVLWESNGVAQSPLVAAACS